MVRRASTPTLCSLLLKIKWYTDVFEQKIHFHRVINLAINQTNMQYRNLHRHGWPRIWCRKLGQISNPAPTLQNTESSKWENYLPLSVYLTHSLPPPFHYPPLFPKAGPSSRCNSALSWSMKTVNGGRDEVTIFSYAAWFRQHKPKLFKLLQLCLVFDITALVFSVQMFNLFDSKSTVC